MASASAPDSESSVARHFDLDASGTGLRVTWRESSNTFNVSLWADNTCVKSFLLTGDGANDLAEFLQKHATTKCSFEDLAEFVPTL